MRFASLAVLAAALMVSGCTEVDHAKAAAYKEQGDFYYQNAHWAQAHAEYKAAIATDEEQFEAYIAIAYTCRMQGKVEWVKSPNEYGRRVATHCYEEANAWIERLEQLDEGNPEGYHLRGLLWFDAGKFDIAIENFDLALDHDPHHRYANFYKSLCLFMKGVDARGRAMEHGAAEEKLRKDNDVVGADKEGEDKKKLNLEAAEYYERAAKAVDSYLANWAKASTDPAPQESDLKNWAKSLRAMASAEGSETDDAKLYMRKVLGSTAPSLTEKGAKDKTANGEPIVRESDLPPYLQSKEIK